MADWLLLHYKLPSEPSAPRVYVWRKLKRLGAVLFQDAVWVLPQNPRTLEQFQWLAAEIREMGGETALWQAQLTLKDSREELVREFQAQSDLAYAEILEQLDRPDPDLEGLSRQYQQLSQKDYFPSRMGQRAREALLSKRGGLS